MHLEIPFQLFVVSHNNLCHSLPQNFPFTNFGIFLFTQSQISQMKNDFIRLYEAIPVFNDQLLPAIRATTVLVDVCVEEMGIRNEPGIIIWEKDAWRNRLLLKL